jgi:hypothetical protein
VKLGSFIDVALERDVGGVLDDICDIFFLGVSSEVPEKSVGLSASSTGESTDAWNCCSSWNVSIGGGGGGALGCGGIELE